MVLTISVLILVWINQGVFGITLTATKIPAGTLTLGNNTFTLTCTYTLNTGEEMYASSLQRKRDEEADFTSIIDFPGPSSTAEATIQDSTLTSRVDVTRPTTDNSLTAAVTFTDVECSDKAEYKWFVAYYSGGIQDTETIFVINSIKSLSTFRDNSTLTYTPRVNLHENDIVTFTCTGDVGAEPVGSLAWYLYKDNAISGGQDVSALAVAQTPVQGDHSCTFKRTSRLELKMTAALNGVSVRCTAQQDVRNEFGDQNNNYKQTNRLDITLYDVAEQKSNSGVIIGVCVSVTFVLLVVSSTVVVIVLKKIQVRNMPSKLKVNNNTPWCKKKKRNPQFRTNLNRQKESILNQTYLLTQHKL